MRSMYDRLKSETTRLREWRLQEGLTLDEVAGLVGVSIAMLSRAERGQRQLAPLTKVQIARRLGLPVRELFELEPIAEPELAEASV
jgi:transcriptional regulator with XRE-family HTH domain